jgi:prevent-host-death family protein
MTTFTIHAAKTRSPKLIERAEPGEEVTIARRDEPAARFVPIEHEKPERRLGAMKGRASVGPEFFEPLPDEELKLWEGG